MKTERQSGQHHGSQVNHLVRSPPTQWTEQHLKPVRRHANTQRHGDARARQRLCAYSLAEFFRKDHRYRHRCFGYFR